ncbi:hypothetical protein GCM10022288_18030 [Gryllotalpicola kribbensis]|uniref:Uncharacterized protein n=1 Tax=Gryllotalpicola kribbensis TaxID=993084 RepID=A0ABP8ATP2_9MICO
MTATLETPATTTRTPLPGARMLRRTVWLIVVAAVSAFGYGSLVLASKGGGVGPEVFVDGNGNHVDANGNPTDATQTSVNVVMHASPVIYVLIAAIALGAIAVVLRRAPDEASVVRILTRAMFVAPAVALIAVIVAYAWFRAIPIDYWVQPGWHVAPFPFGSVEVTQSTS